MKKTRDIYHKQHSRIINHKPAMDRFISMFSYKYFSMGKVTKNFIKNSKILDTGCGDTAKVSIGMVKLGCKDITLSDVGDNWQKNVRKSMANYKINKNFYKLKRGSVTKLPFRDQQFNFTICHGVLIHLPNIQSVKKAIKEMCRVTKKGGAIYIVAGSEGGLIEESILPSIRKFYQKDKTFKLLIDNLKPDVIIDFLLNKKKYRNFDYENKFKLNKKLLQKLFDVDFCVTIQNLIQAPKRLSIGEKFYTQEFFKNGVKKKYRLARYVPQNNIRNIFSHLHYLSNAGNAKLIKINRGFLNIINSIYGSGKQEYIFWK